MLIQVYPARGEQNDESSRILKMYNFVLLVWDKLELAIVYTPDSSVGRATAAQSYEFCLSFDPFVLLLLLVDNCNTMIFPTFIYFYFSNLLIIFFYVVKPITLALQYQLQLSTNADKVVNATNNWLGLATASGKGVDVLGSE